MQAFVTVMDAMGVPYMVSPYEQCAQLKYLSEIGLIDYVMTDNSDAIGYLCEKTLMDYNPESEDEAILYDCSKFLVLNESTAPAPLLKVLRKFGLKSLPLYCALQGCEYVQVKGFGPKKAIQMFIYFWHLEDMPDPNVLVKRMKVSRDTEKLVVAGYNIFTSQIIYDPILHKCRSLKSVVETQHGMSRAKWILTICLLIADCIWIQKPCKSTIICNQSIFWFHLRNMKKWSLSHLRGKRR